MRGTIEAKLITKSVPIIRTATQNKNTIAENLEDEQKQVHELDSPYKSNHYFKNQINDDNPIDLTIIKTSTRLK